jgi:signal transduction histidine kinase
VGFDVGQVTGRSAELAGVGLVSIRERAVQMGGEARFISQPGQGTEVIVEIPLRDAWRQGIRESGNR